MTSVNRTQVPVGASFVSNHRATEVVDSEHLNAAQSTLNITTGVGKAIKSTPKEVPLKSATHRAFIIAIVQDKT